MILKDQVAVVTGGARGIGRAIAERLGADGAAVAVLDINAQAALDAAAAMGASGIKAFGIGCDVTDPEAVRVVDEAVVGWAGAATILVNNAGLLRGAPIAELTLADWNATIAVDLTGYFICASRFGHAMRENEYGSIVHIGSIAASAAQSGGGAYSAAKAGVGGLSSTIAVEWGPFGVRSNVVHPGMIRTAMSAAFHTAELASRRERVIASRRLGLPEDIADAVAYLVSPRSAYVNGAELTVDGGFSRMAIDLVPRPGSDLA